MNCRSCLVLLATLACAVSTWAQPKSGLRPPTPAFEPAEAEKRGRALVAELLSQKPAENSTNTGKLVIHGPGKKEHREVAVRFEVFSTPSTWVSRYVTSGTGPGSGVELKVIHSPRGPSEYWLTDTSAGSTNPAPRRLPASALMAPFAGSDFWLADLGLEFFHWPRQMVTRQAMRKSLSCNILESTNPAPAPGAYSRVVCWIDIESGGIVLAEAYDTRGELLKKFEPKEIEKVQGQWQLRQMEIYNPQAKTGTEISFDLAR